MKDITWRLIEAEVDTTLKDKPAVSSRDIIFDIWEEPQKKVKWLHDNFSYNKIEYKYYNNKRGIEIDFLLGYKNGTWNLWVGKIGATSYSDDPYADLKCTTFTRAIINSITKIQSIVKDVIENPENNVQFYIGG